jgi:hypothetical protein
LFRASRFYVFPGFFLWRESLFFFREKKRDEKKARPKGLPYGYVALLVQNGVGKERRPAALP